MSVISVHLKSLSDLWAGGWPVRLRTTLPEGELLRQMWSGETAVGAEIVRVGERIFELPAPGSAAPYRGGPLAAVVRVQVRPWKHGAMLEGHARLPAFMRGVIWVISLALATFAGAALATGHPVQVATIIGAGLSIFELVHYAARLAVERAMAGLGASVGVGGRRQEAD